MSRPRIEVALDGVLARSPAQPLFAWRADRQLRVLAYHDVVDGDRFDAQMRHLATRMHPVSASDVCRALDGATLPRGAVLVTFDDGDRSVLERGLPVLQAHGIPAVVFVIAGLVDTQRPFWWDEVRELLRRGARTPELHGMDGNEAVRRLKRVPNAERLAALERLRLSVAPEVVRTPQLTAGELRQLEHLGCEIGNHTTTHPCLDRCDDDVVREELVRAHGQLSAMCDLAPRLFAYPNGNVDPRVPPVLRELGYEAAFLFDHKASSRRVRDRMAISRLRVDSTTSMDRFRTILSGLHTAIHRARGLA